jgi:hypothetical protein
LKYTSRATPITATDAPEAATPNVVGKDSGSVLGGVVVGEEAGRKEISEYASSKRLASLFGA